MIRAKHLIGGVGLMLLLAWGVSAVSANTFRVGDRVFVPLFADNLRDDGYATGRVEAIREDGRLDVVIFRFEEGKSKTLYGTCSPNSATALAGARIVSDEPQSLRVEHEMDPADVLPYREGLHQYLERENLSTVISKWLSDGMAITPDRLAQAERRAKGLGLDEVALAMNIAADQVGSTGGNGFPVPASMALQGAPAMLETVGGKLSDSPVALDTAAGILAGTESLQGDDILGAVTARIAMLVREQLLAVEAAHETPSDAMTTLPELADVYVGWYRLLTGNDSRPYLNADLAYYQTAINETLARDEWPRLY